MKNRFDKELFSLAFKNYFKEINGESIKKNLLSGYIIVLFTCFVFPFIWSADDEARGAGYYVIMFSMIVSLFFVAVHSVTLPKLMYLVPTTAETRKKYLKYHYFINQFVPFVISLISMILLVTIFDMSIVICLFVLLFEELLFISLGYNITGVMTYNRLKPQGELKYIDLLELFSVVFSMIGYVVMESCLSEGDPATSENIIFGILFIIIAAVPVFNLLKKYNTVMNYYSEYEKVYVVNDNGRR